MTDPQHIIETCIELRKSARNASDCNDFVIAVAAEYSVALEGNADQILGEITKAPWTQHGTNGKEASAAAEEGALVIGGMTSHALRDTHGHVVVVVKGPLAHARYPTAYWGSQNPRIRALGAEGKTIDYSFSAEFRDHVVYASQMPAAPRPSARDVSAPSAMRRRRMPPA